MKTADFAENSRLSYDAYFNILTMNNSQDLSYVSYV